MRKIIVLAHVSLDGVIQAPGGPDEDSSGSFALGGWIAGYADESLATALKSQMDVSFDLLLGRITFEIWEPYWPRHADAWPNVNTATKYVVSNTRTSSLWQPSVFLNGDVVAKIAALKQEQGNDLHVWGSSQLVQTLLRHELVDEFWLMIYPVTLAGGKRLFGEGTLPAIWKVTASAMTSKGVVIAAYQRATGLVASRRHTA